MNFSSLLDLLFPRECVGCRTPRTLLCENCLGEVPQASPAEHPFIHGTFDYRDPIIKRAIWRFKYKNMRNFAEIFAPYLYDEIIGTIGESLSISVSEKFLLVPIPLHKKRLRERGYNQSALLALALIKLDSAKLFEYSPDILVRARETKPQAKSEKRAVRLANLRDAFTCIDPARVRGRTIILIDDVTTTGATLLEAKRALSSGRPRKVLAFTVGH